MRRFASFILDLTMIATGFTVLIWTIRFPHGGKDMLVIVGGTSFGMGLHLMWRDFLLAVEKR